MSIKKQTPAPVPVMAGAPGGTAPLQYASLDPETFSESGFLDDVDVVVKEAAFVIWDFNKFGLDAAGQKVNYTVENWMPFLQQVLIGPDGKEHDQFWKCGSLEHWMPSEDGEYLAPVLDPATGQPKKRGLGSQSAAGIYFTSLCAAGYPKNKMVGVPASSFAGLSLHLRKEMQRGGKGKDGKAIPDYPVLVVDRINKLPWEAGTVATGQVGAVAGVRRAAPAPVAQMPNPTSAPTAVAQPPVAGWAATLPLTSLQPADDALANRTVETIINILSMGPTAKKDLPNRLFTIVSENDTMRGPMIALAYRDEFLADKPWKYENGILSL